MPDLFDKPIPDSYVVVFSKIVHDFNVCIPL